ncbi:30S ribosomal protein S12 methylthiotransferase RimO [uncultured Dubosiella sp.]|jgi:ribosomal protein S12 methylthiotransferase|uniref:30S ribosomal protein S12 methylthiotransferase RimO n=1 Tax=uncultured Dubosiella sp. TaxID=1937011 RepID=UPI002088E6BA|nr:30S ribosomal protein S12 methylthiotransferase RimO [uncultured Dubosiella sp.]GJM59045.1 ribosomal protein S12 methylthiotransferase RimO [Erysipelotrichaceae bacterium OPF54]GJM59161.1 ribosomal protein S12 methylthiotransferase RimO [Erysipelotrichaceae bacterium OPF54]
MKVGFVSLGCCKNLVDSEQIMGVLMENGHEIVADPKKADAIVVNTCGFIESAKEESINTIFEMAQYADKLIVCGCLAQRYEEELKEEIPEIDAIIPIRDYGHLAQRLQEVLGGGSLGDFAKSERPLSGTPWSAYVKISDGCSNHCTYCAIPLIRGDQKSKVIDEVVAEVKHLASIGVQEITLIAQDTTKYGLDNYGKLMLAELLRQVEKVEEIRWIRVLYMYPDEIEDEVLEVMAASDKILPYFDIPMQHANDRLLKKMNRRGTKEDTIALVKKIRSMFPDAVLRTTAIVGFPSETDEEFEELVDFIREVEWDRLGAFTYSREEDTPAYDMDGLIDEVTAQSRLERLMAVQKDISKKKNEEKVGNVIEVLIEEKEGLKDQYRGRSAADAPDEVDGVVIVRSKKPLKIGGFVNVRITDATEYDLAGEVAE